MDYEDFLIEIHTPLQSIELLTDTIYQKCNECWGLFSDKANYESAKELLAFNYAINTCAKRLLKFQRQELDKLNQSSS